MPFPLKTNRLVIRKFRDVVAECDVRNTASFSLLARLGFRREAHLIENIWFKGAWGSEFHYAMLEQEWNQP
jgi:RimJ/RimL family protein N-acetyltransferase